MKIKNMKVSIVGAGIGGLAIAALLRKMNCDVQIYEQAAGFARVGAGIQMTPNAMHVLRRIGVEERLRSIAYEPELAYSRDYDSGNITNEFPIAGAMERKYGAPFLVMHRADLHSALADVVPRETIHFSKKLVDIEQDPGRARLKFEDGTEAESDMVISSDGVHSIVNKLLFGEQKTNFTGRVAYRATFPASLLGSQQINPARTKWWGPDRHIVIYYVTAKRDELYFVTSQPESAEWMTPESWSAKGDLNELRRSFAAFHPEVRHVLESCPEVHKWGLFTRDEMPAWSQGRITLLGDACHPMPPYMAQGAASALEDAAVLSRCLEQLAGTTQADLEHAFKVYEATRKPRATQIQQSSNANNWLRHASEANPDWCYGYNACVAPLAAI